VGMIKRKEMKMTFVLEVNFKESTNLIEVLREITQAVEDGNCGKKISYHDCKGHWYFMDMGEDE
jgi:hypothetical protein